MRCAIFSIFLEFPLILSSSFPITDFKSCHFREVGLHSRHFTQSVVLLVGGKTPSDLVLKRLPTFSSYQPLEETEFKRLKSV